VGLVCALYEYLGEVNNLIVVASAKYRKFRNCVIEKADDLQETVLEKYVQRAVAISAVQVPQDEFSLKSVAIVERQQTNANTNTCAPSTNTSKS